MLEPKAMRLLVVDDDEDDLYLINEAIGEVKDARYAVDTASSALSAMAKLAAHSYDVVISDYRLGAVTGIDFIKNIRAAGIDTPVILLTGLAAYTIDHAALEAGASDFLPKGSLTAVVLDRSIRYAIAHADRQRLLQAVLRSTTSGVAVLTQRGDLTLWNPRFVEFAQAAYGETDDRMKKLVKLVQGSLEKDLQIGEHVVVEAHRTTLPDGGTVLALHDVTARVSELKARAKAEQKIRKIALTDSLTGLPNRMAFNTRLDQCLIDAAKTHRRVAVFSFDFDRFKEVNDIYGHAAGDKLLQAAASRLGEILTESEYVARLGGDEFVLIHENPDEGSVKALGEKISSTLTQTVNWENRTIEAGVSVGVAVFPDHGESRETLLANADLAMYRAKCDASSSMCIFDASMDQFVRERRKIAVDLKRAIENDELSLHFQPQYNAKKQALTGFEALLRWKSRTRGYVPPSDFILVAEENGLISEIDEWVLRTACHAAAAWPVPMEIAVNISARAICDPGIVDTVREIVIESGLSPSRLELEVTETALIHDLNRALHNLRQIKALGISIAMDDFGTGYSSLSLLNSFPFDRVKVDKSFIQAVGAQGRADSIFRAVVGIGGALSVPVLIEGVETPEQLAFALAQGCEEFQGYYFSKPMVESEAIRLMQDGGGAKALFCADSQPLVAVA